MALLVLWSYFRGFGGGTVRLAAGVLKLTAAIALSLCLVEPLLSGLRPRPGANLFVVAADNSQSLQLRDAGETETRAGQATAALRLDTDWQTRLAQDFDVRRYLFDSRVQPVADFSELTFAGRQSALTQTLTAVTDRFRSRPVAGVLMFTDGNATDWSEGFELPEEGPPIYPVVLGSRGVSKDIRLERVSVSQTNFEASPVTILVEAKCEGYSGSAVVFQLLTQGGVEIQRQTLQNRTDGEPLVHRFRLRPEESGVNFYRVRVFARTDEPLLTRPERVSEATLKNNSRLVMVDQGGGPYRVLYVGGRPNWEFKFLRRAIQDDDQVHLVGLLRIAKKEPKFTFRGRDGESTNPLFRGFDNQDDEEAEQYDQPVLLRLGVKEEEGGAELRDGFPQSADELFSYDAVILDEIESAFFTQDQMSLLQRFVSERGGGLLMLGGRDSFDSGKYDRTPVGEMLPVYLDRPQQRPAGVGYRLKLTREGWLQPWARLRTNEQDEEKRLAGMPPFHSLNPVQSIKPGATVLAHVESGDGRQFPALAVQRFGKGRSAALLVGDLWRWNLRRKEPGESDLEKAWRQTVRWLVGEVPSRVDTEIKRKRGAGGSGVEVLIRVHDEEFQPLDNASVTVEVSTPDDKRIELTAAPSAVVAGGYTIAFSPRMPGGYRGEVVATAADGSEIGRRSIGWATEPASEEFRQLQPNREMLASLAEKTGGEMLELNQLDDFARSLPNRRVPVTEPWTFPLWHQWGVLLVAISCLAGEWGLRRWKGLP